MAAWIIESVGVEPAKLRMVVGSQALESTPTTLRQRVASFEPHPSFRVQGKWVIAVRVSPTPDLPSGGPRQPARS